MDSASDFYTARGLRHQGVTENEFKLLLTLSPLYIHHCKENKLLCCSNEGFVLDLVFQVTYEPSSKLCIRVMSRLAISPIWTFYVQKYVLYPTSTVGGNFSNFVNAVMTQMMVTFACNYSL